MTAPFGRKPAHARSGRTRSTAAPSAAAEGRRSQATRSQATRSQATRRPPTRRTATPAEMQGTRPLRAQAPRGAAATGAAQAVAAPPAPDTDPRKGPERHLEVVRRPSRHRLTGPQRARLLVGGGAVLSVGIAFALVFLHVFMAQRQFQLDRLSSQVATAQTNYSQLRLQVAQLEAPQQIIATAEGKLGMRQPGNVTYLTPSSPLPPAPSTATNAPGGTTAGGTTSGATIAPSGDADWPRVKSQMAGSP